MEHKYGWQGKTVRNADGRTGTIAIEDGFGPWLDLHIECQDGTKAKVKLNARGRDSGEAGWQWWCPEFADKPAWLPLGEHGAPLAYAETPNSDNYAHPLSTEADSDPRLVVEDCGYAICEDSDQPGMWVWITPSDGGDIYYESRELALAAAWQDAVATTLAILDIRCERWGEMTLQEHSALVLQALAPEDAVDLHRPQV